MVRPVVHRRLPCVGMPSVPLRRGRADLGPVVTGHGQDSAAGEAGTARAGDGCLRFLLGTDLEVLPGIVEFAPGADRPGRALCARVGAVRQVEVPYGRAAGAD